MQEFRSYMEIIGIGVDAAGVVVIIMGALYAAVRAGLQGAAASYRAYRQDLGRSILLGLEFLVAGDIIRTVVVSPTIQNVIVLALIVLIRTFLSMALEVELEGRWPWQKAEKQ